MAVYLSVANKNEVHVSNIKKLIHHLTENTLRVYYKHQQCKFSDYHGGVFKSGYKNEVHVSNIKKTNSPPHIKHVACLLQMPAVQVFRLSWRCI